MSFGENLERIRKGKNVSQKQLGDALGLTQQMISSYEKDFSAPNMEVLLKLASYFNVSLDTLVGYTPKQSQENTIDEQFLSYYKYLNEKDKERCLTIVQTIVGDRALSAQQKRSKRNTPHHKAG